ncbi:uncharacterized protein L969DRAFT_94946 [Mixia osmundae IAM 14324]|uniref:Uncharacterized protein n=1 Tax=Mixia osmundae (strain CBS 9802 / IAM 14324 / JCM 22182 / KY 12970) TaxID=764103 RepID=G7E185_MIXOS|nr:uncharacterized protein L969DRAFT_94946 [Mixia osmundae IAM 14324]KEI38766.1 hypothetical protein L969DRAFT_94946 [Mixia osmundae IAM 14324]GAA96595.1 hypothetical protein E5Q_03265 [Mixia osmundae IAM 14324]
MIMKAIITSFVACQPLLVLSASINASSDANTLERRHFGSYKWSNFEIEKKENRLYTVKPTGLVAGGIYEPPSGSGYQQVNARFFLHGDHFKVVLRIQIAG